MSVSRTAVQYKSIREPDTFLKQKITDYAFTRVHYGYKRIHVLLSREGIHVNAKKVHRIYCEAGLQLGKRRKKRHVSSETRSRRVDNAPSKPNECWAMDFVSDNLQSNHKYRVFALIDRYTRECLSLVAKPRLGGADVVEALNSVGYKRGFPSRIQCDNGSEFFGRIVDLWAYQNKVKLAFSRPATPTDNAHVESFIGTLRQECLNYHWFDSIEEANQQLQQWLAAYNETRPHKALDYLTPCEYRISIENQLAKSP